MTPIDILPADLETVRRILRQHVPAVEVRAFGSRVAWNARETSDLDLALMTDAPLTLAQIADLRAAFTDADLPFRVDIVDWASTPEDFRRLVEAEHAVLVDGSGSCRTDSRPARSIEDVCLRVTSGGTPSRRRPSFYEDGCWPWLKTQELQDGWLDDSQEHITEDAVASSSAKVLPQNTVLMAMYGATVGQLGILRRPMTCNQACCAMIVDPGQADYRYLFYQLLHARPRIKHLSTGAAQQNLSGQLIKSLKFPFPPLPEQRAAAHILGTLDDKIELNRRMNATLEAMARALFRSWFVDFDPVRAKMEGRDTGLPKEIADMFPDRLVESELGEMPEGWTVGHVEDGFEIVMGQSPPGHTYNDVGDGLPFFQGRSDFGFRYPTNRKFCTAPNRLAQPWDTIVSVRAPVGDINMAWERCCIGRGVAALRPRCGAVSYGHCAAQALQTHMREYEHTGTVFGAINRKQLARLPLTQPAPDVVGGFEVLVHPWDQMIRLRTAEIATLTALRDTLLPKLVSGEVRVSAPEPVSDHHDRSESVGMRRA